MEVPRLFNSKRMVITSLDELLALRGEGEEQVWTGFHLGFTRLEASNEGQQFLANPFHSFVTYKRFL